MIISASRRTDIPSLYSDWFIRRVKEGFVYVRNPMNFYQISKIDLRPKAVDCFVFWSKNPSPMIDRLGDICEYTYYFQYTLNAYGSDTEPGLPPLDIRIGTFRRLCGLLGPKRVIWRYDPILSSGNYTISWHIERFSYIARRLEGCTEKCIISFVDFYPSIASRLSSLGIHGISGDELHRTAAALADIARPFGICVNACAEKEDLLSDGVSRARCIDASLISELTGRDIPAKKDKNQRGECGCAPSTDIGAYGTCHHGCVYCYAMHGRSADRTRGKYDPKSPLLCSSITSLDRITDKRGKVNDTGQIKFY